MNLIDVLLCAVLVICVLTDLKERRIYNKVIYPSLLLTLCIHLFNSGWEGLLYSILGFFRWNGDSFDSISFRWNRCR